jgi:hypothetical protein
MSHVAVLCVALAVGHRVVERGRYEGSEKEPALAAQPGPREQQALFTSA